MNTKLESGLKEPKQRDLLAGKKYRDTVKKWGEPTNLLRKRVFIVPSIACEARDVDVGEYGREKGLLTGSGAESSTIILSGGQLRSGRLLSQYDKYKAWVVERKKLRSIITQSGLNQNWLEQKSGKTPLEKRVLKRMKRGRTPDIRVRKVIPDVVSPDDEAATGVDKGVPTIKQPSPAALAVIQEYLDRKRMRLVDLFAQADKDKNWIVSRDEFRNIIKSSGIPLSASDLEDLIMALDKDGNDALDYLELSTGRQAYLDERIERLSPSTTTEPRKPNLKIPESLAEESKGDVSEDKGDSRPTSPQRRSPPSSPTLKELPDRDGSPSCFVRRGSSPSLLEIPAATLSEKVEKVSLDEIKVMRMKKQQKRKEREKAKQKKKQNEKPSVAPSTLGGTTGAAIDRYRIRTVQEYNDTVKLCDMHGVQLSKALLGRVLLQPEDKPIAKCLPRIRQPGFFSISTRHHIPSFPSGSQNPDWML
ncbi:hypothetical protein QZH41_011052 [Actinostola sp. cb2023]|nr:hypothetical protein QZH41_011052 [Actinostola sp. cb2023]